MVSSQRRRFPSNRGGNAYPGETRFLIFRITKRQNRNALWGSLGVRGRTLEKMRCEMTVESYAEAEAATLHRAALPLLTLDQLDADPHGVLRQYRKDHAVVLHETGGYFVLRFADVERLGRDPRVGPSGTSVSEALGIRSGAIYDLFKYSSIRPTATLIGSGAHP
jgi:hypothetical protein